MREDMCRTQKGLPRADRRNSPLLVQPGEMIIDVTKRDISSYGHTE